MSNDRVMNSSRPLIFLNLLHTKRASRALPPKDPLCDDSARAKALRLLRSASAEGSVRAWQC
jgi:hypothetical protein